MTFTHALATNNYGPAKFIVDATAANGTHTTIAAALTSASSGDTIFIRPGTYTENLSLKAGVFLTAYGCNGFGGVAIVGKCTFTAAGTVGCSGIIFQTNSDFAVSVTGSANSTMYFTDCSFVSSNNTAVQFNSSGTSASLFFESCTFDLQTTGIAYYTMTAGNNIHCIGCFFNNSGASSTASNVVSGSVLFEGCSSFGVHTSTSTGSFGAFSCNLDTSALNVTPLTLGGSGATVVTNTYVAGGSASAISVGGTVGVYSCTINSSNTNAITGAGTLTYGGLAFPGSAKINTTTQTGGTINGGLTQAPTAGYIGEQISSAATSVATTSATPKSITSISLTAGIWDISAISSAVPTGGAVVMSTHILGISTTDNTLIGNIGDSQSQISITGSSVLSACVPQKRATLTTTTVYYAVVDNIYTSTTCPTNARITATRVG